MSGSTISNCWASGAVTGNNFTGGLVGQVNSSSASTTVIIENSFATGSVTATTSYYAGGLIGASYYELTLNNSFATGEVTGFSHVGGLIGDASGTAITHNFATGKVTYDLSGPGAGGALVGYTDATTTFAANYFARDKGITNAIGSNGLDPYDHNPAGTTGATLTELQCPTTADNTSCAASPLYENWDTALWDFGSNLKLPGLIIGGIVYRDGDGKGLLDNNLAQY